MRKILLLILLVVLVSCKPENDVAGNSMTDEVSKIYAGAEAKLLAEQRSHENDPALKDYYEYYGDANYDAAFASIQPAALAGNSQAQAELASVYMKGQGVPVNINTAMVWLARSHEQGNKMASVALGEIYNAADLGHRDFAKAYVHYEVCAMQLRTPCIVPFAMLHVTNGSGHYDPVKAAAWLEIGVDQEAPGAAMNRDSLVSQLSKEQVAQIKPAKLELLASIARKSEREPGAK